MNQATSLTIPTPRPLHLDRSIVLAGIADSFRKLDPRVQVRNPVMFVVYVGSILTTLLWIQALRGFGEAPAGFILGIAAWLAYSLWRVADTHIWHSELARAILGRWFYRRYPTEEDVRVGDYFER